ncbi:EAL domain-containing protein [Ferrimonas sediminicola]|uniref:EAL domain-containing protein n=1 Tax=Ferrimonas sediminicola TaxID=2569538 RepID=A0A4U1B9X2_9GAMM|nr:GGDEF domain-containing phosphodiesterase [Ferrimonas sediminicola]TKB47356.1 EAL domain-containing protein [Ferrimonas sediminicola]
MHLYQPYSPTVVQSLHWVSLAAAVGFGLFHLVTGFSPLVGWLEIIAAPFLLFSLVRSHRSGELDRRALLAFTLIMMMALVIFTRDHGFSGLAFVFPVVAGLFYLMSIFAAGLLGGAFTLLMFAVGAHSVDGDMLLRFGVSVLITYCFIWFLVLGQAQSLTRLNRSYLTDPLTGLANRRAMDKWLTGHPAAAPLCLFQLNIHQFKSINQRYGRATGDALLQQLAHRLKTLPQQLGTEALIGQGDALLARTSGDEFVLGLPIGAGHCRRSVADAIHQRLTGTYQVFDHQLMLSLTLGYSRSDDASASDKLQQANMATIQGKATQPGLCYEFSQALAQEMEQEAEILQGLKRAINLGAFELKYMPIHGLATPWCSGAEVLVRSTLPELAGIGPDRFIPVAEKYGLIYELDLWIIQRCFAEVQLLSGSRPEESRDLRLALNISSMQLNNPKLASAILSLASRYDIDLNRIDLELTETALVSHSAEGMKMLTELRDNGIKVVLDDFGTGFTAFSQLQHYPIDRLKIDRSFVSQLGLQNAEQTRSLVDVILRVAAIYEIPVTAEGVETREQEEYLMKRGCHHFQGYLYSPPVPLNQLLARRRSLMAETLGLSADGADD